MKNADPVFSRSRLRFHVAPWGCEHDTSLYIGRGPVNCVHLFDGCCVWFTPFGLKSRSCGLTKVVIAHGYYIYMFKFAFKFTTFTQNVHYVCTYTRLFIAAQTRVVHRHVNEMQVLQHRCHRAWVQLMPEHVCVCGSRLWCAQTACSPTKSAEEAEASPTNRSWTSAMLPPMPTQTPLPRSYARLLKPREARMMSLRLS